jgi:hypothetical protein
MRHAVASRTVCRVPDSACYPCPHESVALAAVQIINPLGSIDLSTLTTPSSPLRVDRT